MKTILKVCDKCLCNTCNDTGCKNLSCSICNLEYPIEKYEGHKGDNEQRNPRQNK